MSRTSPSEKPAVCAASSSSSIDAVRQRGGKTTHHQLCPSPSADGHAQRPDKRPPGGRRSHSLARGERLPVPSRTAAPVASSPMRAQAPCLCQPARAPAKRQPTQRSRRGDTSVTPSSSGCRFCAVSASRTLQLDLLIRARSRNWPPHAAGSASPVQPLPVLAATRRTRDTEHAAAPTRTMAACTLFFIKNTVHSVDMPIEWTAFVGIFIPSWR